MSTPDRRRILIIEDEIMISLLLEDMLRDLGHDVVGVAATAKDAVAKIEADAQAIDAATLDVNLAGIRSHVVADALAAHRIPFVVMTGYSPRDLSDFDGHLIIHKPFIVEQFEQALQSLELRQMASY